MIYYYNTISPRNPHMAYLDRLLPTQIRQPVVRSSYFNVGDNKRLHVRHSLEQFGSTSLVISIALARQWSSYMQNGIRSYLTVSDDEETIV